MDRNYFKQILEHLGIISVSIEYDSDVHLYISRLFKTMLEYQEASADDPRLIIIMTLYHCLATENNWINYTGEQFQKAIEILSKAISSKLSEEKVYATISDLEAAGFELNPFNIIG